MAGRPGWLGAVVRGAAVMFSAHVAVGCILVRIWEAPTPYALGLLAYPPSWAFLVVATAESFLRATRILQGALPWGLYALLFTSVVWAVGAVAPVAGIPVVGFDGAARTDLVWQSPWALGAGWVASWAIGYATRPRTP